MFVFILYIIGLLCSLLKLFRYWTINILLLNFDNYSLRRIDVYFSGGRLPTSFQRYRGHEPQGVPAEDGHS